MRHFLRRTLGQTQLPLSCRVLACAFARALVDGAGATHRFPTADRTTVSRAVDLASVARLAHAHLAAAARAEKVAQADGDVARTRGICKRRQGTWPAHASEGSCEQDAMAKIGRNEPCPCGSGKKHKRCCLTVAAPSGQMAIVTNADLPTQAHQELCPCCVDNLNERADHVVDELLAGRVDEAEALCQDFLHDFPGQAEGIDLLSMICEQRGQRDRALELLREASAIAHANPEYDAETRYLMRERIQELELQT